MIAFWRHDSYPYVLGGKVIKTLDYGSVEVKGYPGFLWSPILVVPDKVGEPILKDLEELRKEFRQRSDELVDQFKKRAVAICPLLYSSKEDSE